MSRIVNQPARSKEEISQLIEEWQKSNLSKKEFADSKGIKYMTFIDWFGRRKRRNEQNKFVPLQIATPINGLFAEVHLSSTKKILLHQPVNAEFIQAIIKC